MPNNLISDGIYEILNSSDDKYITIKTKPFRLNADPWACSLGASEDIPVVAYSKSLTKAKKEEYTGFDFFNMETQEIGMVKKKVLILSEELTTKKKTDILDTSVIEKYDLWRV